MSKGFRLGCSIFPAMLCADSSVFHPSIHSFITDGKIRSLHRWMDEGECDLSSIHLRSLRRNGEPDGDKCTCWQMKATFSVSNADVRFWTNPETLGKEAEGKHFGRMVRFLRQQFGKLVNIVNRFTKESQFLILLYDSWKIIQNTNLCYLCIISFL